MKLLKQPSPTFEIRRGESFHYAREILKPYGELDRVLAWCKTELTDEWRWQLIRQPQLSAQRQQRNARRLASLC